MPAGLAEWARLAGPGIVLNAVRTRAQRGYNTESGALSSLSLTQAQRREVGRLLGNSWELSGKSVRLQMLAARLREHGLTVRELAEHIHGSITANAVTRVAAALRANTEYSGVHELLCAHGISALHAEQWLADKSLPRPGTGDLSPVAVSVCKVWKALPPKGREISLAQLAAEALSNSHALDYGEPLGRAVARLAAVCNALPRPRRAGVAWRAAWASVRVLCDTVSARALVLNLPLIGPAPAARLCAAAPGEPVWLTLRSLEGEWSLAAPGTVFVCENVTIVEAAADALGQRCPPMICTDGIATTTALELLVGLAAAGYRVRARADFDPAGFTVVGQVLSVVPNAEMWRFDEHEYAGLAGVDVDPSAAGNGLARLRTEYRGAPIHEERLLPDLLDDLGGYKQDQVGGPAANED